MLIVFIVRNTTNRFVGWPVPVFILWMGVFIIGSMWCAYKVGQAAAEMSSLGEIGDHAGHRRTFSPWLPR